MVWLIDRELKVVNVVPPKQARHTHSNEQAGLVSSEGPEVDVAPAAAKPALRCLLPPSAASEKYFALVSVVRLRSSVLYALANGRGWLSWIGWWSRV